MKKVNCSILFLAIILLFSRKGKEKTMKNQNKIASDTTKIFRIEDSGPVKISSVDSIKYRALIDSAKWLAYCIYSDRKTSWRPEYANLPVHFFASLECKYTKTVEIGDTAEIYFSFYYNDLRCDYHSLKNYDVHLYGIAFNKKSSKKIYFINGEVSYEERDPRSRYVHELQPDVVSFIRRNKNLLNLWFRGEAIRRKVI